MIKLKKIVKEFKTKNQVNRVLDDISLEIEEGSITGIIGYSGAGKSTLLRLINGLVKSDSGEIEIDGINPSKLSYKETLEFRKKFGMIFQHFNLLWSKTVYQNVKLALEITKYPSHLQEEKVMSLLKLVGLEDKKDQYPSSLSGGEKQRVGIARALINEPKYLLCDEPTSALDPKTTRSILNLLEQIRKELQITIIIITHQIEVIQALADRVIVIDSGKIIEDADLMSILINPKAEITKKLVASINQDEDLPLEANEDVYHLSYIHGTVSKPLINEIIIEYGVEVNILQAKINQTRGSSYGTLVVTIAGENQKSALKYLEEQGVKVVSLNGKLE